MRRRILQNAMSCLSVIVKETLLNTENLTKNKHISLVIRQSFSFQNNPKNLDPSYKMNLDLCDCLGKVKLVLQQNFIGLI